MKKAKDILADISHTVLWDSGIKIIEQAQKEAWNAALDWAMDNATTKMQKTPLTGVVSGEPYIREWVVDKESIQKGKL